MNTTRWPLIAIGCVAALIGACLLVGGAVLLGAQVILRDAHGFYTSPDYRLTTSSYAVVVPDIDTDLGPRPGSRVRLDRVASVRITTEPGERAVFAGIARSSDVSSVPCRRRPRGVRRHPGPRCRQTRGAWWNGAGTAGRPDLLDRLERRNRNAGPHLAGR